MLIKDLVIPKIVKRACCISMSAGFKLSYFSYSLRQGDCSPLGKIFDQFTIDLCWSPVVSGYRSGNLKT